jgi:hypothetical protein
MSNELLKQTLAKEFEIADSNDTLEKFLEILKNEIKNLLKHNTEKLAWILYRIDVKESDTNKAFLLNTEDEIATTLTHLIYVRQIEKLKTRSSNLGGNFIDL